MKNCLIIKDADFSENAVEHIEISSDWAYNFTLEQWESAAKLTLLANKDWTLVTTPFYGRIVTKVKLPSKVEGTITINETTYQVSVGMNTILLNTPVVLSAETTITINVSNGSVSGCNTSSLGPTTQEVPDYSVAIDFGFK